MTWDGVVAADFTWGTQWPAHRELEEPGTRRARNVGLGIRRFARLIEFPESSSFGGSSSGQSSFGGSSFGGGFDGRDLRLEGRRSGAETHPIRPWAPRDSGIVRRIQLVSRTPTPTAKNPAGTDLMSTPQSIASGRDTRHHRGQHHRRGQQGQQEILSWCTTRRRNYREFEFIWDPSKDNGLVAWGGSMQTGPRPGDAGRCAQHNVRPFSSGFGQNQNQNPAPDSANGVLQRAARPCRHRLRIRTRTEYCQMV